MDYMKITNKQIATLVADNGSFANRDLIVEIAKNCDNSDKYQLLTEILESLPDKMQDEFLEEHDYRRDLEVYKNGYKEINQEIDKEQECKTI